jgi:hypothetical protein
MTQLADLISAVGVITNRPDLVSETTAAVKRATLKVHVSETFQRDLAEIALVSPQLLSVSSVDYRYQIALSTPIIRFRRIAYLRANPTIPSDLVTQYRFIEADSIFDDYSFEQVDYFYIAGSTLNLRTLVSTTGVKFGYYQYPDITDASFYSWIADVYPNVIIDEAAAAVFKMIGKDDEETRYRQMAAENYHILQAINIY